MTVQLLSSSLSFIPTHEPTDLVLQPSLSDTIANWLRPKDLRPYDERWQLEPGTTEYLRACLATKKGAPRSVRCWEEPDPNGKLSAFFCNTFTETSIDHLWQLQRPASPILTLRSLRETPLQRSRPMERTCPGPIDVLVKSLDMQKLLVPRLESPEKVDLKDAMYAL